MGTINKKIVLVFGMLMVLLIAGVAIGIIVSKKVEPTNRNLKRYDREWGPGGYENYLLSEKMPTEIVWIGELTESSLYSDRTVRYADSISHETLRLSEGYQRLVIVVNDLSFDLNVTRDQYDLIFTYIFNNPNYYFMYLGKEDLPLLGEISGQAQNISDSFYSMGFSNLSGSVFTYFGTYTSEEIKYEVNPFDALIRWITHIYEGEGL